MASKKVRARAAALHAAGLLSKNYTRKKLTDAQIRKINRTAVRVPELFNDPDNYTVRRVGRVAAAHFREAGYKMIEGRVIIPHDVHGDIVHVVTRRGKTSLHFARRDGLKESVVLVQSPRDLFDRLHQLPKLREGERITVRIGDRAKFAKAFTSSADLEKYISRQFVPRDEKTDKNYLISQMTLVRYTPNGAQKATKTNSGN